MSKGVHGEEKRLRRIFERALWIALTAPLAVPLACSSTGASGTSGASVSSSGAGGAMATGSGGAAGAGGLEDGGAPEVEAGPCSPRGYKPVPNDLCGAYVHLPCGLPEGTVLPGDAECSLYLKDCAAICPGTFFTCHAVDQSCLDGGALVNDSDGGVDIDCVVCPDGVGRVPAGLVSTPRPRAPGALGEHFAAAAHFEAASVHAFRRLRNELAAHRAPKRLLRSARRAQRDEVRHAQLTARMARRFGGMPARACVGAAAPRALDAIALENAVEGCVRETFGALVASFQAANARDPAIARLMASIARDETRHAALSWSVARWARRQLGAAPRAELGARCRSALESLRREADPGATGDLRERAGLPSAAQRRALLDALEAQLPWRSASI